MENKAATFAEAFIKLQAAIKPAIKDAKNEAFKRDGKASRYADLSAIWDAVKEPLKDNGFAVIQMPQFEGETMYLETTLIHIGGDKITGRYPLKPSKLDPQGFGSAITYARRYALSAMLGVIADDDDDGNAASVKAAAPRESAPVTAQVAPDSPAVPSMDRRQAAANWCYEARDHVLAFETGMGLDKWVIKHSKAVESARALAPNAHKALTDAIARRGNDLNTLAAE